MRGWKLAVLAAGALLMIAGARTPVLADDGPTALIEELSREVPGFRPLAYLGPGQIIPLPADATIVISYFASCVRETITGGYIRIGQTASTVEGGRVETEQADCSVGEIEITTAQLGQAGSVVTRGEQDLPSRARVVATRTPLFLLAGGATLVVERLDQDEDRITRNTKAQADNQPASVDLAKGSRKLTPGGLYRVTARPRDGGGSEQSLVILIDRAATSGAEDVPVLRRLVRL